MTAPWTRAETDPVASPLVAAETAAREQAINDEALTRYQNDNALSDLVASASQAVTDHLADAVDAHDASAISFTPTGTIASTDAQTAIAEVATDAKAYADSLLDAANAKISANGGAGGSPPAGNRGGGGGGGGGLAALFTKILPTGSYTITATGGAGGTKTGTGVNGSAGADGTTIAKVI